MRPSQISRGGAPVGFLSELDPIESTAITYLRLWCQSLEAQDAIARDFEIVFGQTRGKEITDSFEALCKLCVENGRRPLMRHGLECKCFGADESCFANFIGYASEGAREDALMIAMTIVQPEKAHILAALAEDFGLALRDITSKCRLSDYPLHGQTPH